MAVVIATERWDDEPAIRGSNELLRVSYLTFERRVLRIAGHTLWRGRPRLVHENILGWWADQSVRDKYRDVLSQPVPAAPPHTGMSLAMRMSFLG